MSGVGIAVWFCGSQKYCPGAAGLPQVRTFPWEDPKNIQQRQPCYWHKSQISGLLQGAGAMPIYKDYFIIPKILVCEKCGKPVEYGFVDDIKRKFSENIYNCQSCDSWTKNVKWVKIECYS